MSCLLSAPQEQIRPTVRSMFPEAAMKPSSSWHAAARRLTAYCWRAKETSVQPLCSGDDFGCVKLIRFPSPFADPGVKAACGKNVCVSWILL